MKWVCECWSVQCAKQHKHSISHCPQPATMHLTIMGIGTFVCAECAEYEARNSFLYTPLANSRRWRVVQVVAVVALGITLYIRLFGF